MDSIQKTLLEQVAGLHEVPQGAYSLRINGSLHGKNDSEKYRREKSDIFVFKSSVSALEYIELEHSEKIKSEEDYYKSRDYINNSLIFYKEAAECSGKCAEKHENRGESKHKSKRVQKGFGCPALLLTSRKVRYVYGKHRKKTGRYKSYNSFKK